MQEAFYFGRFQPPLLKHGMIAREALQEIDPDSKLTIGIAQNKDGLNRNNILRGDESVVLFNETLGQLGIPEGKIAVETVEIDPTQPLSASIQRYWLERGTTPETDLVIFSGSPSTIKACTEAQSIFSKLRIKELDDDDQTGPRARTIRQCLFDWDVEGLLQSTDLAAQAVLEFLAQPFMLERISELPNGEKRPWANTTKIA